MLTGKNALKFKKNRLKKKIEYNFILIHTTANVSRRNRVEKVHAKREMEASSET